MAHATRHLTDNDTVVLGRKAWPWFSVLLLVGAACTALALLLSVFTEAGIVRFGFSYLTAYAFVFALTLGALFFVVITHLFRAGWCVVIRRIAEAFSRNFPLLAVLFLPIAIYVFSWSGELYPWAQDLPSAHADAWLKAK